MSVLFTTERLTVRKFKTEDWEDLAEILTDPEVTYFEPYETFTRAACVKEAESFAESDEFYAVILDDKVIGKIYFSKRDFGTYEIGYTFHGKFQGKGYACESVKGMMAYAFKNMGVRRIIAEVNTRNDKSNRLVERLGMRREAEHKEIFPNKADQNKYEDFYVYAVLAKEFEG